MSKNTFSMFKKIKEMKTDKSNEPTTTSKAITVILYYYS